MEAAGCSWSGRMSSRQTGKPLGDGHWARDSGKTRDETHKANCPYGAHCVLNKPENRVKTGRASP